MATQIVIVLWTPNNIDTTEAHAIAQRTVAATKRGTVGTAEGGVVHALAVPVDYADHSDNDAWSAAVADEFA
jgi:hypothetical protein